MNQGSVFLRHSVWKFFRSSTTGKDLSVTIILGLLYLLMSAYLLAMGFALEGLITKILKQPHAISFLNSILVYYFVFEFVLRYFLQHLPVMDVQPYLHLPIKRSAIIHYLLGRSLFHATNCFVLLLFAPFAITVISAEAGVSRGFSWLMGIWLVSLIMHYSIFLFKKKLDDSIGGLLLLVGLFGGLAAADYVGWIKLSHISAFIFDALLEQPMTLLLPVGLLALAYFVNFSFLKQALYPEEMTVQQAQQFRSADLPMLKRWGITGVFINTELKLIIRNKRPRTILWMSGIFLLYGLIFFNDPKYAEELPGMFIFVGVFVTGIFLINYGQFLFSWQAGHYDFTLTRPIATRQWVESKYWLLASSTFVCFLLSVPYVYFGWQVLMALAATFLFNVGVNTFVIMNMAMWDPKRINLAKGGTLNYEGVGAAQWLLGIPILLAPYLFYAPLSWMGYPKAGVVLVAFAGLAGVMLREPLLKITTNRLEKRKYQIASGFRKE